MRLLYLRVVSSERITQHTCRHQKWPLTLSDLIRSVHLLNNTIALLATLNNTQLQPNMLSFCRNASKKNVEEWVLTCTMRCWHNGAYESVVLCVWLRQHVFLFQRYWTKACVLSTISSLSWSLWSAKTTKRSNRIFALRNILRYNTYKRICTGHKRWCVPIRNIALGVQ